jgi:putative phosphoesterase
MSTNPDRFAVIADVHGNRWALEAVLNEIQRRGIDTIINLGDSVYGALDPGGSAELLRQHCAVNISGNQDRILHSPTEAIKSSPNYRFILNQLDETDLAWLRDLPATFSWGEVLCCHGTPASDETYLLEHITPYGVFLQSSAKILELLGKIEAQLILCGHSHVYRTVYLPNDQLIVNPGSVGVPAYSDDSPYPHVMEAGSPHARFAVIERGSTGWQVDHVAVVYDWSYAANIAEKNGRSDLAEWIRTGRATLPTK